MNRLFGSALPQTRIEREEGAALRFVEVIQHHDAVSTSSIFNDYQLDRVWTNNQAINIYRQGHGGSGDIMDRQFLTLQSMINRSSNYHFTNSDEIEEEEEEEDDDDDDEEEDDMVAVESESDSGSDDGHVPNITHDPFEEDEDEDELDYRNFVERLNNQINNSNVDVDQEEEDDDDDDED